MSETFAERLRRLRREEGAGPDGGRAERGAGTALPEWFRQRGARRAAELDRDPKATVGPPADLVEESCGRGVFAARQREYPEAHRHGAWELGEVDQAEGEALALFGRDARLGELGLRRAVFLDIETTGLSGGAGTVPFLVGLGCFEGSRFRLWQGFVRSPDEEAAMLAAAAERIAASDGVVSFFGKSFDRHRLEDKMRVYGIAPPFDARPHLDLYHPCHRLYAPALPNGRLQTMEQALLELVREDDLPGSLAPAAWFDFLAGRPHRLEDVFRHNELDVLSLVALAAHLGRGLRESRPSGARYDGPSAERAAGIAALLAAHKRREEALAWIERAIERCPRVPRAWRRRRAELLHALGRSEEALAAWRAVARGRKDRLAAEAWLAVARLEERARRDLRAARAALVRAEAILERVGGTATLWRDIERRRARLERPGS